MDLYTSEDELIALEFPSRGPLFSQKRMALNHLPMGLALSRSAAEEYTAVKAFHISIDRETFRSECHYTLHDLLNSWQDFPLKIKRKVTRIHPPLWSMSFL